MHDVEVDHDLVGRSIRDDQVDHDFVSRSEGVDRDIVAPESLNA